MPHMVPLNDIKRVEKFTIFLKVFVHWKPVVYWEMEPPQGWMPSRMDVCFFDSWLTRLGRRLVTVTSMVQKSIHIMEVPTLGKHSYGKSPCFLMNTHPKWWDFPFPAILVYRSWWAWHLLDHFECQFWYLCLMRDTLEWKVALAGGGWGRWN